MALTLISVEDGYAVYEDENGHETLLAGPGPLFREVTLWEDFDLESAWFAAVQAHRKTTGGYWSFPDHDEFIAGVRLQIADVDSIDVVWCENCHDATRAEFAESVGDGTAYACESCYESDYHGCSDCGNYVHSDSIYYTLHDESVCNPCLSHNYSHCDDCDGYYHHNYESDHDHSHGCDCEPPTLDLAMRNDGEPVLNQDERVSVALPAGMISEEGIHSIARLIREHGCDVSPADRTMPLAEFDAAFVIQNKWWSLARDLETLGSEWQTREGNYTKRLSKLAYKSQGLKIAPEVLSQVGCIARDNSTGVDFDIEVTRDLNLPAEEFYHEDSCWWQSYSESRCALKSNGGIGMRTFDENGYVKGRAWIMPLRADVVGNLTPTFDSLTADAFMVFNGYGNLSGYTPARIVAHMAGMTYRKIGFGCTPMYVNGNSGYLVAPEELAVKYASLGRLSLYVDTHASLYHSEESARLVSA